MHLDNNSTDAISLYPQIDPGRIKSGTQEENMKHLKDVTKKFIDRITQTVDQVPK